MTCIVLLRACGHVVVGYNTKHAARGPAEIHAAAPPHEPPGHANLRLVADYLMPTRLVADYLMPTRLVADYLMPTSHVLD